ncbi:MULTISPECIES: lysozyme [Serratia]|jgi:lysozyme|uniref:Lysozyme n=2 Tax=Serratia TaxID=613 RepID=A0ABD6HPN7_SERMA|nr:MULTISPECIES: lysozyme [Serratia]ALL39105.1 muraminidase [Serratia marcescens]ANM80872.1 phage lysozyme family protein [Serratia marcescens]EMF04942.1 glycoside hydrolase family 24 [Serratia marcescens VGH107]KFF88833.1 muraminidase [Serratia nematodiphila DZ0503SBS1]MBH2600405.1 lysozyme [Serratia marcescens]
MKISDDGMALIKRFEGLRLQAYQDSVGVWTIGYGWTQPVAGRKVGAGMAIDAATAERLLVCGVAQFEQGVERLVAVTITQGQFDALVSFAYNLGLRALEKSTLLRRLNAGDRQGAADQFGRWVNAGGVRLDGLVARRAAERALFLS